MAKTWEFELVIKDKHNCHIDAVAMVTIIAYFDCLHILITYLSTSVPNLEILSKSAQNVRCAAALISKSTNSDEHFNNTLEEFTFSLFILNIEV